MNFRVFFAVFTLFLVSVSCDPDGFPNQKDMVGTWVEVAPKKDTLIFRSNGSMIRHRGGKTDTLIFRTNGERGTLTIFNPNQVSEGENTYNINFVSDNQMLLENYYPNLNPPEDGNFIR